LANTFSTTTTPASIAELTRLPAHVLASRIRSRDLGCEELVRATLGAIERWNPHVNAIVTLTAEQAIADARAADAALARGEPCGILHGVPVGIKDNTPVAGVRTTYGAKLHEHHVAPADDEIVRRLRAAGAIVIGKTNTPEFACGGNTVNEVFGDTRNPCDPRLSAAGSTGGGACALACGMIGIAQGTDFGGSLRMPGAFCGVSGIRATAGLVPPDGPEMPWDFGSVQGPMARSALDIALALDAMRGWNASSPISVAPPWSSAADLVRDARDLAGLRIAFVRDIANIGVDPEIEAGCRRAALALRDRGATVEEIEFDLSDGCDAYVTLRGQWYVTRYVDYLDRTEVFGPNVRANIHMGLEYSLRDVARAEAKRREHWERWGRFFERFDLLATPTAAVLPFPVERNHPTEIAGRVLTTYIDWAAPTFLVSLVALVAAQVPAGLAKNGMPIGLQLIGRRLAEPTVLAAAKFVEEMQPLPTPTLLRNGGAA